MIRNLFFLLFLLPVVIQAQTTGLSGLVATEDGASVNNVVVSLFDEHGQLVQTKQTVHGEYAFTGLASGEKYTLKLDKAGHPLNGVSTFDLVRISRHMLAVEPFQSLNQLLVSDIDGSRAISVVDLLYLRKLILGIVEELPLQRNWLFLEEGATIPNGEPINTFEYELSGANVTKNFLILKFGDLNKTAIYE